MAKIPEKQLSTEVALRSDKDVMLFPSHAGVDAFDSITSNGNGTCNIGSNTASFYDNARTKVTRHTIAAAVNLSLTDEVINYVCADRDTDSFVVILDMEDIDYVRYLLFAEIYRAGTFLHIQEAPISGYGLIERMFDRMMKTQRYAIESGFDQLVVNSSLEITLNGAHIWAGFSEFVVPASSTSTREFFNYHSSGVWTRSTNLNPKINNTQYDDGTNLQTLTDTYWTINYIFRGIETNDHMYIALGAAEFSTKELAAASLFLPEVPPIVQAHSMFVGRVIAQKNATTDFIIEIVNQKTYTGAVAVNAHNALSGLNTGDYIHLTATQYSAVVASLTQTFIDSTFKLQDDENNTRQLKFQLNQITNSTTRIITARDSDGTLAYTSDIIPATTGGTGQTTYTVGDILYASTASALSKLADVSAGSYLRSGGVGVAPLWSTLKLLNTAVVGDILFASASNTITSLADVATGNALISGGIGVVPSYGKIGLTTHITGTLPIANGGTGQTAKAAAFDALSPTSVKGDLIAYDTTENIRVAVGNDQQILIADSSTASGLRWGGILSGVITPDSFATRQDNYNPTGLSTSNNLRLTATSAASDNNVISGFAAPSTIKTLCLTNIGTISIVLSNNSTNSLAANRILMPLSSFTIRADGAVYIQYDVTSSRWRIITS